MNIYDKEEDRVIDIQLITTTLFIISLFISISLTYNDKLELKKQKTIYTKRQYEKTATFNRILALVLSFSYLYISYKNKDIARKRNQKLDLFDLQINASQLSVIAAIIVLYVVIRSDGENYSIIPGIENPNI